MTEDTFDYKMVVQHNLDGVLMAYVYAGDSETPVVTTEAGSMLRAKRIFYGLLAQLGDNYTVATEVLAMSATRVEYGE